MATHSLSQPQTPGDRHTASGSWTFSLRKGVLEVAALIVFAGGLGLLSLWASLFSAQPPLAVLAADIRAEASPSAPFLASIGNTLALLWPVAPMLLFLCVVHEWCHGTAYRHIGVRPRYGYKVIMGNLMFYATAAEADTWITRSQYLLVTLAPTVGVNALGLLLLALPSPLRVSLIFAFSMHLAGCGGDWLWVGKIRTLPAESEFEDTVDGFRYRRRT